MTTDTTTAPRRVRMRKTAPVMVAADSAKPKRRRVQLSSRVTPASNPEPVTAIVTGGEGPMYKIKAQLGGKLLFAYQHAMLTVLGLYDGRTVPKTRVTAFYASGAMLTNHTKQGFFMASAAGVQLTPLGQRYFRARLDGTSPQRIPAPLAEAMLELVRGGGSDSPIIPEHLKQAVIPIMLEKS